MHKETNESNESNLEEFKKNMKDNLVENLVENSDEITLNAKLTRKVMN
jgi:hypothetical protein